VFEIIGDADGMSEKERYLLRFKLKLKVIPAIRQRQMRAQEVDVRASEKTAAERLRREFERRRERHGRGLHIVR
jgi:hypothetical protein